MSRVKVLNSWILSLFVRIGFNHVKSSLFSGSIPESSNQPFESSYGRLQPYTAADKVEEGLNRLVKPCILLSGHFNSVLVLALLAENRQGELGEAIVHAAELFKAPIALGIDRLKGLCGSISTIPY